MTETAENYFKMDSLCADFNERINLKEWGLTKSLVNAIRSFGEVDLNFDPDRDKILTYFENTVIPHKVAVYQAGMALC